MHRTATASTPLFRLLALAALLAIAPSVFAHHPLGGTTPGTLFEGLASGVGHPVIGLDHLAFVIVVALLSATLSGAARFVVPLAFVGATVVGTLYHVGAANLPLAETVIALSVLLGGLAVLLRRNLSALLLGVGFAGFGLFHGYAYGEAIIGAETTPMLAYLAGFALIQYAIIAGGVALLGRLARRSDAAHTWAVRATGLVTAAAGAAFLASSLA
jgi:urease accessory protein